jgi:hypothetical protein
LETTKNFGSMVFLLNKWFSFSYLSLFLLTGGSLIPSFNNSLPGYKSEIHPFHVSVTEVNHNATQKTLEISCKLFTDDFESILGKINKTKIDLINPVNLPAMDTMVKKYIISHLSITANGKPVGFSYLGYEHDKEAVFCYLEVSNVSAVSNLRIKNTLMYDLFEDQINIMHVIVGGNRKSTKLNYPDNETVISF